MERLIPLTSSYFYKLSQFEVWIFRQIIFGHIVKVNIDDGNRSFAGKEK